ncbi:MAG: hypothetical protein KY469_20535 [Actinobacteria bacterium]|nr:hypothetical protein [Actinomycetota bacterium]
MRLLGWLVWLDRRVHLDRAEPPVWLWRGLWTFLFLLLVAGVTALVRGEAGAAGVIFGFVVLNAVVLYIGANRGPSGVPLLSVLVGGMAFALTWFVLAVALGRRVVEALAAAGIGGITFTLVGTLVRRAIDRDEHHVLPTRDTHR